MRLNDLYDELHIDCDDNYTIAIYHNANTFLINRENGLDLLYSDKVTSVSGDSSVTADKSCTSLFDSKSCTSSNTNYKVSSSSLEVD